MSENHIVFVEQPFKLDMVKLATAYFRGVTWGSCLKFDKDDAVGPLARPPPSQSNRGVVDTNRSVPDLLSRHQ